MNHAVYHVRRVSVRGGVNRFHRAALVYRDIHNDAARRHRFHHLARDELRRFGAFDEHRADHRIRELDRFGNVVGIGIDRGQFTVKSFGEIAQPVNIDVNDRDIRAHAESHTGRGGPNGPAAKDDDIRGTHTGHTAQKLAAPAIRLFEIVRRNLNRHLARNLAHRREERKRTVL